MATSVWTEPRLGEALLHNAGPWSEEDFLELRLECRVELLDGSLLVTPAPRVWHQIMTGVLRTALAAAAPPRMTAWESINLRLGPGRILVPDVTVIVDVDPSAVTVPPWMVPLVVEVSSPGNMATERTIKPALYAEAGIPSFLRIEPGPDGPTGLLFSLAGGGYVEGGRFPPGEPVRLVEPFPVEFDLAALSRID